MTSKYPDLLPKQAPRPRGRPPTMSEEQRRRLIVEVGFGLFLERGYARTTMDDVAEKARISKRSIYDFFQSKKDLFGAVVIAHRQTMLALPRRPGDDLQRELEAIFDANLSEEAESKRSAFVQMVMAESHAFPELGDTLHRFGFEEAVRLLSEWLEQRRAEGLLDFEDAGACAELLMLMAFAPRMPPPPLARSSERGPTREPKRWKDHLRFCIRVFLGGVQR